MSDWTFTASNVPLKVWKHYVIFQANGLPALTITNEGQFILGPDASIDDAARALVNAANALHATQLAAAITRADEAETRAEALAAEVIRLRADNEQLRQRVTILWEENNAARAALEDKT